MILYIENPKANTENLLELISEFSNAAECQTINIQKSIAFYTTTIKISKI